MSMFLRLNISDVIVTSLDNPLISNYVDPHSIYLFLLRGDLFVFFKDFNDFLGLRTCELFETIDFDLDVIFNNFICDGF